MSHHLMKTAGGIEMTSAIVSDIISLCRPWCFALVFKRMFFKLTMC